MHKNNFSTLVNSALSEGPHFVTKDGQEVVVILSAKEYRKLIQQKPNLLDSLMNTPFSGSNLEIVRDKDDTYNR